MQTISEWWMWLGFFGFIFVMLFVDLFLLGGKRSHRVSTREALGWVIVWLSLALIFNLLLWFYLTETVGSVIANAKSLEFLTGYLIEESLSVDNMFVFLTIFNYLAIPAQYQHRTLIYGVIGAVILRLVMILFGLWLIQHIHWILYGFGLLLLITGFKMLFMGEKKPDLSKHRLLQWMKRHLRVTDEFHGERFTIRQNNILYFTPLFLAVIMIEASDVIFAIDSIPAILAVTTDPFIVFTSNIFAILGLRSLYFLLVNAADRFHYLHIGLAMILVFIGIKMLVAGWIVIPIGIALGVVAMILLLSMMASLLRR